MECENVKLFLRNPFPGFCGWALNSLVDGVRLDGLLCSKINHQPWRVFSKVDVDNERLFVGEM